MARNRLLLIVISFLAAIGSLHGQTLNRYMVFFKDKTGTPFSTSDSLNFLSQKAIDRRIAQGIFIDIRDLPVNPAYVQGVRDLGVSAFFTTRWMNGVLVQCEAVDIPAIEGLSFVDHVDFVAPGERLSTGGRKGNITSNKRSKATEVTKIQREMIGIDYMHNANNRGEGKIIAVMDSGFPGVDITTPFQSVIAESRIDLLTSFDFVYNTSDVFQYDDHGTQVLSVMTAFKEGEFVGGAYKASYQLFVTEDVESEYRIEEYNWLFAAERADSAGADIINTSLGYYDFDDASMNYAKADMNGTITVISRAAQWAADRGMIVVCSAGNEGSIAWQIITAPADAVDVVAVANVSASGVKAPTSSIGPSADNRIKPDLAALGQNVSVIRENGNTGSATGTSVAAPLITSLVAGVWQRYPELTSKEVVELIKRTASQANDPDNELGYGIPNFRAVVNYQERVSQNLPFVVFPNPVINDTINIRPSDPEIITSCTVELISVQGQIISSANIEFGWLNRTYQEDLSSLTPGLYFLHITSDNKRFTFKVIKR